MCSSKNCPSLVAEAARYSIPLDEVDPVVGTGVSGAGQSPPAHTPPTDGTHPRELRATARILTRLPALRLQSRPMIRRSLLITYAAMALVAAILWLLT